MKSFKKLFGIIASVIMSLMLVFSAAACDKDPNPGPGPGPDPDKKYEKVYNYDPEKKPLTMSISQPDQVFNPFISTSAYDTSVIGMTQVSMINADKDGNEVYGDSEPTVVKDMRSTYNEADDTTTYDFIIKNGIKFSDGKPLTINDVLFNLYVYLDPVYTGSATVYSTDIVGLDAYRTQNPNADEKYMETFEEGFRSDARIRRTDLTDFMKVFGIYDPPSGETKPADRWNSDEKAQFKSDYKFVASTFRDELFSDYNAVDLESYKEWNFTAPWQIFLMNDGGMTELLKTDAEGKYIKDKDGNFQYDPEAGALYEEYLDTYLEYHKVETDFDANDTEKATLLANATRDWAVNMVYFSYFVDAVDENYDYVASAFEDANIDATIANTSATDFATIVNYWQTATTVFNEFVAQEKTAYFAQFAGNKSVKNISGIDGTKTTTTDYQGNDLGEPHSVLSITINKIDPKAKWNFAFTVAPMHYYSGKWTNPETGVTKDYIASFDQTKGEFGIEYGNSKFMTAVVNDPAKNLLPVGAGAYMASKQSGGAATSGAEFMNLNVIYYERNPHFWTLGGVANEKDSKIQNAKIKYFRYQVVGTDEIINSITNGGILVGEPNATQPNKKKLDDEGVAHKEIMTAGYGYIGLNPKFVPNINVRRAIMKAMNTQSIFEEYYAGGLAQEIYRPMSKSSWAYPQDVTTEYTSDNGIKYDYDSLGETIEQIVKDEGYEKDGTGVYCKTIPGFGEDRLDYTLTIAGSSQDHPAYNVFVNAEKLLNRHGFAVKVSCSQTALTDLTAGKLAIWAAAWSSTIDPDMYQVYHKDSQATSVNNWGYDAIKANTELYSQEWTIINDLSDLIERGRMIASDDEAGKNRRARIYAQALDKVMELAVEFPTYQRNDMTAYDQNVIDVDTLTPEKELSSFNGLFSRIWEVNYTYTLKEITE